MKLGTKKIIYIRKGREKKKFLALFVFMLIFIFVSYGGAYMLNTLRPAMISLAKSKAKKVAITAINDAAIDIFTSGNLSYTDILQIEKDDEGKISAVKSNLESVSVIKSKLSKEIIKNIEKVDSAALSIPLGTVFGTDILAGIGPRINVSFVPYGVADAEFMSDFYDAGINQTRLAISLKVNATLGLLMPTANTSVDVETILPVLETIIVGDVPNSYTNVERTGEDFEDDVLQLAE